MNTKRNQSGPMTDVENMTFKDGIEYLQGLENEASPQERHPVRLPINAIKLMPSVFQMRDLGDQPGKYGEKLTSDERHVRELFQALRNKPERQRTLDPIVVVAMGSEWFCIDGHHRLEAYRQIGTNRPVPVEVFQGRLSQAVEKASKRNSKDKLPMSSTDKMEAAWRLDVLGEFSKREVMEATGASDGSLGSIRRVKRALQKKGLDPLSYT
jgi:hypothetical protein